MKLIIVGGPTASGKTKLALEIAREFNGELINADSRQIYKYLNIGTNKEIPEDIPLHLIDIINPDKTFNVFEYKKLSEEKIQEISTNGKVSIIVGGTGLYIDALIKNYDLIESDSSIRDELNVLTVDELQTRLNSINPQILESLNISDKKNPRRLVRLIEKASDGSIPKKLQNNPKYEILFLYPKFEWEEIKERIDKRVEEMFKQGLVEETQLVLDLGFNKTDPGLKIMGYKEVIQYLENQISLDEAKNLVKTAHKQYAKRQRTWFEGERRGYELIKVISVTSYSVKNSISHFLDKI